MGNSSDQVLLTRVNDEIANSRLSRRCTFNLGAEWTSLELVPKGGYDLAFLASMGMHELRL